MIQVKRFVSALFVGALIAMSAMVARADAPSTHVGYQPMVSTGLAAKNPFEAWFIFDKSDDPSVSGYAIPAGTSVRFTFPKEFTPIGGNAHLEAALLYGWPHGAIGVPFRIVQDPSDAHTVVVHIDQAIAAMPPEKPGLKAIHIRTAELNPSAQGDYAITVEFTNAGSLSGTTKAIAHITGKPVPNVAAYNQLHQSKDEDWQHVKAGAEAPLPLDFLVTLPDESRSTIGLARVDGGLNILSDGKPIGTIRSTGASVTLAPESFGPGFTRLGIIRVRVNAGQTPGTATIKAALNGGTAYEIRMVIEQ